MTQVNYCTMCGGEHLTESKETRSLAIMGFPDVSISGLTVLTCDECGEGYREYPSDKAFLKHLARGLVGLKRSLSGKELAFLRKHLGIQSKEWAANVGAHHVTLSKWENEKAAYSKAAERALRYQVAMTLRMNIDDMYQTDTNLVLNAQLTHIENIVRVSNQAWGTKKVSYG